MLRVLLNHPDFTSPAGASWKARQILGEHISTSYMVWHQMYSRTMVQAQTSPGSRTVRPLINILTTSYRTTSSLSSSLFTVHPPLLPFLPLFLFPFDILSALFLTQRTVTIVAKHCFEYNGDISMCLELIRPDFSLCEKSNTPKGQKNNKHLQLLAVWHSIFIQTVFAASGQPSLSFLRLKGTKQSVSNALNVSNYPVCYV